MKQEELLALIQAVSNSHLTHFSMEENGIKITMKTDKGESKGIKSMLTDRKHVSETTEEQAEKSPGSLVKCPLVGTFYSASSPEEEPFVKVGDLVHQGQVLGIVEAMKLMNEITSEYDGVVKEILVENQQTVEYGQPLFVIG